MRFVDPMLAELQQEGAATRRLLERVPEESFGWRPHSKSMTLGQLALHVAEIPGRIAEMASQDVFEVGSFASPQPASKADVLAAHDRSLATALRIVASFDDGALQRTWKAVRGDREMMALPRGVFLRAVQMNHLYHHRGQLTVFLRLLDVPVPSLYGPSADENPFA